MDPNSTDDWDVDILGVRVSAVNMDMALTRINNLVSKPGSSYVCVTGVHGIISSLDDQTTLQIHNDADMVTPDGMPTVWSGKQAGASWMSRVYGPDLLLAVCQQGLAKGWRHYFYGGGPDVANVLSASLRERFPSIKIVGYEEPPMSDFPPEEVAAVADRLKKSDVDIVWVGLSTPKQERVCASLAKVWPGPVFIGVGAAFDFHSGRMRQAPKRMQRLGLEWLFRLLTEPRRLWSRYFRIVPLFSWRILRNPPQLVRHPATSSPGETKRTPQSS